MKKQCVTVSAGNPKCRSEVRRWEHGCYTLAHDTDVDNLDFALDLMLYVGCDKSESHVTVPCFIRGNALLCALWWRHYLIMWAKIKVGFLFYFDVLCYFMGTVMKAIILHWLWCIQQSPSIFLWDSSLSVGTVMDKLILSGLW